MRNGDRRKEKETYPNLVASTTGGYDEQRTDWRKRAGTMAYLMPRNWRTGMSGEETE